MTMACIAELRRRRQAACPVDRAAGRRNAGVFATDPTGSFELSWCPITKMRASPPTVACNSGPGTNENYVEARAATPLWRPHRSFLWPLPQLPSAHSFDLRIGVDSSPPRELLFLRTPQKNHAVGWECRLLPIGDVVQDIPVPTILPWQASIGVDCVAAWPASVIRAASISCQQPAADKSLAAPPKYSPQTG